MVITVGGMPGFRALLISGRFTPTMQINSTQSLSRIGIVGVNWL